MALKILRSRRKTLCIEVAKPNIVTVRAPLRCSQSKIERFINNHDNWIKHKLAYYVNNPGLPTPTYRPNSTIWLLGRPYTIKQELSNKESVLLFDTDLVVKSRTDDDDIITRKVTRWVREFGVQYFNQRAAEIHLSAPLDLPDYHCRVRKMKRQWGNCSRSGEIKLNLSLIHYPEECIDYVICHEFCHLLHFNHGKAFYSLQQQLCPEWQQLKHRLETFSGF